MVRARSSSPFPFPEDASMAMAKALSFPRVDRTRPVRTDLGPTSRKVVINLANRGHEPAKGGSTKEIKVPMKNQHVPKDPPPVPDAAARTQGGRTYDKPVARP